MSITTGPKASLSFKKMMDRVGELLQWSKAWTTLPEDLPSISSTHVMARNHLQLQFQGDSMPTSGLDGNQACAWCTDIQVSKTLMK